MATSLIQAWTTENETAVVWGTHDLQKAKEAYRRLALDTEPDWDTAERYFAAPRVLHIDNWTEGNIGIQQTADRSAPFLVFDF